MKAIFNQKIFKGVSIQGKIAKGLVKNGVVFWRVEELHSHTIRILNRATAIGAIPDTDLIKFDLYVRSMVDFWTNYCDVFYRFRGTGDANFKRINLANPEAVLADFYGGYTLDVSGIKGNGVNAYVDSNFNPSLLVSEQKYQLNIAGFGVVVSKSYINRNQLISNTTNTVNVRSQIINILNVSQRINRLANLGSSADLSGDGLKLICRTSTNDIFLVNKGLMLERLQTVDASIYNNNFVLLLCGTSGFGDAKISSGFVGKSVPFTISQEIRTHENADMTNLGITPIA